MQRNPENHKAPRMFFAVLGLGILLVGAQREPANASIVKGALVFDDDAFADTASMIVGSIDAFQGPATTVQEAICGLNLATAFEIGEFDDGKIVEIGFSDNSIVNYPGPDLVIYEAHYPDGFDVALDLGGGAFSPFVHFETAYQGFSEGGFQNAALIDLSDFGVGANELVSTIRVLEDDYDSAELSGIGALNSVPEPGTAALLAMWVIGILRRRT